MKYFLPIFAILLVACAFAPSPSAPTEKSQYKTENTVATPTEAPSCAIEQLQKTITGNSMVPLLKEGDHVILLLNYYKCGNKVQKGDYVAYDYKGSEHLIIKTVRVTDQDIVEISGDRLLVNGEVLKNAIGEEYHFQAGELKMLALYIKDGHIPANSYFIFGENTFDSTDSRKFGAVSATDFYGKFLF